MSDDLDALFDSVAAEYADNLEDTEPADNQPEAEPADENEDQVVEDETIEDDEVSTETDEVDESDDEATAWDWTQYQDQLIPVTIDGNEELVTLAEWRQGYQRQADYTRGKQAIAEIEKDAQWAKDFWTAYNADPAGVLEDLAKASGLLDQQPQRQEQPETQWNLDDLDEDVRPFAQAALEANRKLEQMQEMFEARTQQERQQAEQQRLVTEVKAELDGLVAQYAAEGVELDQEATLRLAARGNLTLTEAADLMVSKSIASKTKLQGKAAETAAEQALANAEKQRASKKKVASQKSKTFRGVDDISVDDFDDIGDLMEQVMAASGESF